MPTGIVIPHDETAPMYEKELDDLAAYQAAVGGFIEPVRFFDVNLLIYANEEGKLRGLPFNRRATAIWWLHDRFARETDELVGDVVLLGANGGGTRDIPPNLADLILRAEQYRVEIRLADRLGWHDRQTQLGTYVDAAVFALLDFRSDNAVTDIRVVAAT